MSKELQKYIEQLFQVQDFLGSGAYGHVWKVKQKSTQKTFALKKIFDAFQNQMDAQRTYRQISILYELSHINIIKLKAVIKSKNQKHIYLLFQHLQTDLHSLVGQNILQISHLIYITYQIFKSLKYIHSAQLIHRDLKPSNILINSQCEIKLCDFGLVRSLTKEQDTKLLLTEDVATRWYRSPEMILASEDYGPATDIWSVGCILAELLIGKPIMMGDSNIDQLQKILQLTGIPKQQDMISVNRPMLDCLFKQMNITKRPFFSYFKDSKQFEQKKFIHLISRMLQFKPSKRITVDEVLNHQIFTQVRCRRQQLTCQKIIIPELDDNIRLSIEDYRRAIYKDIERRYPEYNSPDMKYYRAQNSLIDTRSIAGNSVTRKTYNSLIRPARKNDSVFIKHELLAVPNRNTNFTSQHQSSIINKHQQKNLHSVHLEKPYHKEMTPLLHALSPEKSVYNRLKRPYIKKFRIKQDQLQIEGLKETDVGSNSNNYNDQQNKKVSQKKSANPYYSPNSLYRKIQKKHFQNKINDYSNTPFYTHKKVHKKVLTRQKKEFYQIKRRHFAQMSENIEYNIQHQVY